MNSGKGLLVGLLWFAVSAQGAQLPPLPPPQGLRPCCAFGYHLQAEVLGIPVPFYQIDNVVTAGDPGKHRYNDSLLAGLANLMGMGHEHNGIIYTARGGFIDTAHIRDTADMTVYLFSQLMPELGHAFILRPDDELAERRVVFNAFTPPVDRSECITLAAWLSAHLAFQLAAWHEIAQWYGFASVPGFSEEVSAFSPEDLYSNLLGARIAVSLILHGQTTSEEAYNRAMDNALPQALKELGAEPARITRFHFDMLDGHWWDSKRRLPEKYLVLRRNYDVSDNRLPTPVPGEQAKPWRQSLPHRWQTYDLDALAELQLWPGNHMKRLPVPGTYYTVADFSRLAAFARDSDRATKMKLFSSAPTGKKVRRAQD
ncbi:TPA: DUF4056 domain-containing protein [Klebsiella oxytoca]|uniref:DUF4056 domain-containing protein n=1 Tax=Klebsiella oxytoca TaxID=571 RepID=A0AAN5L779_KLEOX|nr:DUF4056 domain-containing protein [Klebsiella oxytoca]